MTYQRDDIYITSKLPPRRTKGWEQTNIIKRMPKRKNPVGLAHPGTMPNMWGSIVNNHVDVV